VGVGVVVVVGVGVGAVVVAGVAAVVAAGVGVTLAFASELLFLLQPVNGRQASAARTPHAR
jgi:hypothetical protein